MSTAKVKANATAKEEAPRVGGDFQDNSPISEVPCNFVRGIGPSLQSVNMFLNRSCTKLYIFSFPTHIPSLLALEYL